MLLPVLAGRQECCLLSTRSGHAHSRGHSANSLPTESPLSRWGVGQLGQRLGPEVSMAPCSVLASQPRRQQELCNCRADVFSHEVPAVTNSCDLKIPVGRRQLSELPPVLVPVCCLCALFCLGHSSALERFHGWCHSSCCQSRRGCDAWTQEKLRAGWPVQAFPSTSCVL